jgi:taurine transport system permease protein
MTSLESIETHATAENPAEVSGRDRAPFAWEKLLGAVPFVVLFLIWWLVTATGLVHRNIIASPAAVWSATVDLAQRGLLQDDIVTSLVRLLLAMAVSLVLGVSLGILAGLSRPLSELLIPLASFFNSISGIAWIPLAIVWFGLGTVTVTFVLVNSIFFLIFFNTVLGVRSVPAVLENAVRTLGGGRRELILQVYLPGALPFIMSGIRGGFGFGWRALIAAELIAATSGLGYLIYNASNYSRADQILAGIIIIGALWVIIDMVVLAPIERRTVQRWGTVRGA